VVRSSFDSEDVRMDRYHGDLIAKFLNDGRLIELTSPFGYTDPAGQEWKVPSGARVDGASIPPPLWPLIGSPLTGKYRDASVIHDWYCDRRSRPWRAVHRVFHHAMTTSGVDRVLAKVMYAGVLLGGPRWSETVVYNQDIPATDTSILGRVGPRANLSEFGIRALPPGKSKPAGKTVVKGYQMVVPEFAFDKLEAAVRAQDPSLEDIERLVDAIVPDSAGG
jgi:Protein of unknown function (DUF1353)